MAFAVKNSYLPHMCMPSPRAQPFLVSTSLFIDSLMRLKPWLLTPLCHMPMGAKEWACHYRSSVGRDPLRPLAAAPLGTWGRGKDIRRGSTGGSY